MKKILTLFLFSLLAISCVAQLPPGKGWKNVVTGKGNFNDTANFAKTILIKKVPLVATATDLNKLAGISTTSTEFGYVHGVTSAIQTQLNAKQASLVSGTNIKTVAGISLLGSGDIPIAGAGTVTSVSGTNGNGISFSITNPTSAPNITISLGDITPSRVNNVALSSVSSSTLTVSGTASVSGANTGDNAVNSLYSGLVSNATHTGDVTGSTALTIASGAVTLAKMANMATASVIYRKTAGTGAPEVQTIATLKADMGISGTNTGDQTSVTGNAGTATKLASAVAINGVAFDGSTPISVPSNIAPGASGNIMKSNGSVWTSATAPDTLAIDGSNSQSGTTYTLQSSDAGGWVILSNASPITVTVPLNTFPVHTIINIVQGSTGTVTISPASSVTLHSSGGALALVNQYSVATLYQQASNVWIVTGKLQ